MLVHHCEIEHDHKWKYILVTFRSTGSVYTCSTLDNVLTVVLSKFTLQGKSGFGQYSQDYHISGISSFSFDLLDIQTGV